VRIRYVVIRVNRLNDDDDDDDEDDEKQEEVYLLQQAKQLYNLSISKTVK
jgi:hypothetical protein